MVATTAFREKMGFPQKFEIEEIVSPEDLTSLRSKDSRWHSEEYTATIYQSSNERRLVRTIDWKILPLLCSTYFLQFMDKNILNYANVMGLQPDLHMNSKGNNQFVWAGTSFFLAYLFAELPQGVLLQKFPVTKILGINIFLWGIVTASTAAVQNGRQLLALRTLLGLFEAVVTPSLIMITSAWYRRREGVTRFGIWFCGLGIGQIIGGLVSFAAQHSHTKGLEAWRLMFLVVGVANTIISIFIYRLPNGPHEAKFLSDAQKNLVAQWLKDDHAGTGAKVLRTRSIWEAVFDLQSTLLGLITILTTMSAGVVVYFSTTIITSFGFDHEHAALLNMPSGVVAIVSTLGVSYIVRNGYERWVGMIIGCVVSTVGACLMSFLPKHNKVGLLIGVYLVNAAPAVYTLVLSTVSANYRGYTRKIAGSAFIASAFSVANIISPQTFQARDAPNYTQAKITLVVALSSATVVALCLRLLYGYRNARANMEDEPAMSRFERNAVRNSPARLDFADRGYRYSY